MYIFYKWTGIQIKCVLQLYKCLKMYTQLLATPAKSNLDDSLKDLPARRCSIDRRSAWSVHVVHKIYTTGNTRKIFLRQTKTIKRESTHKNIYILPVTWPLLSHHCNGRWWWWWWWWWYIVSIVISGGSYSCASPNKYSIHPPKFSAFVTLGFSAAQKRMQH